MFEHILHQSPTGALASQLGIDDNILYAVMGAGRSGKTRNGGTGDDMSIQALDNDCGGSVVYCRLNRRYVEPGVGIEQSDKDVEIASVGLGDF